MLTSTGWLWVRCVRCGSGEQDFFGHSAKDDTLAESAIIAIQLSSPAKYDRLQDPQNAARAHASPRSMVRLGYATKAEAEAWYHDFRDNFDYTRTTTSAYNRRVEDDKAPWFSEYVRRQLEDMLYRIARPLQTTA